MFEKTQSQTGESQQAQNPAPPQNPQDFEKRMENLSSNGKKQGKRKKIYSIIGIILILIFTGGTVAGSYYFWDDVVNFFSPKSDNKFTPINYDDVICAMDVKECPDGSFVSRIPPDCEFAECPVVKIKKDCIEEGERITTFIPTVGPYCCQGMESVISQIEKNGECIFVTDAFDCIDCPNGECGLGENRCNCPEDCGEEIEEWFYCNSKKDCVIENFDCSWCECTLRAINKNYLNEVCKNFNGETCGLDCQEPEYNCVDNRCKIVENNQSQPDTSDWQTYRNEEFEFEFKYPEEYHESAFGIEGITKNKFEEFMKDYIIGFNAQGAFSNSFNIFSYNKKGLEEEIIKQSINNLQIKTKNGINYYYFDKQGIIMNNENSFIVFKIRTDDETEKEFFDNILSTFKFLQDIDNDGLFDDEEIEYGCDMNNPDTDGDGFLDGDEVKNGYNPADEGKL